VQLFNLALQVTELRKSIAICSLVTLICKANLRSLKIFTCKKKKKKRRTKEGKKPRDMERESKRKIEKQLE
jgi:hypothetical protein